MPRPNRDRSLENEQNLARRIALEREGRGMTYEGLARRMSDAGCATHASALYKVEKGNPPRRVTVSELIALASIFETPIEDLLMPPELRNEREAWDLLHSLTENLSQLGNQVRDLSNSINRLHTIAADSPEVGAVLRDLFARKPWIASTIESISDEAKGTYEEFVRLETIQSEASES